MKRKIAAGLLAAAMSAFGLLTLAAPAHASSAGIYCFQMPNGHPWDMETAVQVNIANIDANWTTVTTAVPDSAGCVSFTLDGTYQNMFVRGYTNYVLPGAILWGGVTPNVGLPGGQYADLGVGVVYCAPISPSAPCPPGTVHP